MEQIAEAIVSGFIIACWGWTYSSKLVQDEEVFSFMPNLSEQIASLGMRCASDPIQNPNYIQNAILKWGYKCGTCHAGIHALGMSIYGIANDYRSIVFWAVMLVMSIFFCEVITRIDEAN